MNWYKSTADSTDEQSAPTNAQQRRDPTMKDDWWVIAKLTIAS